MKRAAILIAAGLMVGCSHQANDSTKMPEAEPKATAAMEYPAHEGEPTGMYYETRKDGKTYVTGYVSTANMIREGQIPAYMVEKPKFSPDGDTVYFESDGKGLDQRLMKDYQAQHKK